MMSWHETPSTPAAPSFLSTSHHAAVNTSGRIDPVVQGVKPERRLLLGLLTQLASQFGDFRRQLDPRLHLRSNRRSVGGIGRSASFRSGTVVQADLLTFEGKHEFGRGPSLHGSYPASPLP